MKRKGSLFFTACCVLALWCCAVFVAAALLGRAPEVSIPSANQIVENGYPVNQNGETYGPDVKDWTGAGPDLVLVENKEGGVGYVRQSEIPGAWVSSPEEAMEYMENRVPGSVPVNLYLEDGVTVVGEFLTGE